jgi:long-subunit fatty acid transport protein
MKKILAVIISVSLIIFCTAAVWGDSVGQGARAIGMGGAYTAVADDVYAPYWNPAGITQIKHFGISLGLGYQGDLEKLENVQDAISDNEMPTREDMNQSYELSGFLGAVGKYFGLSGFGDLQLNTVMDDAKGVAAGTNMTVEGYGVATVAFTIGEDLAIGINFKAVAAGYGEVVMPTFPDINDPDFTTDAQNYTAHVSYNTGTGTAYDIGALLKLSRKCTLGFVARNAFYEIDSEEGTTTNYKLDFNDPNDLKLVETTTPPYIHSIEIPKTYVLGIAYKPFQSTTLALDVENITNTSNDQTRIHFGLEQTALWNMFALRLGCFTNKGESLTYTAGLGFRILWVIDTNLAIVKTEDDEAGIFTGEIKF